MQKYMHNLKGTMNRKEREREFKRQEILTAALKLFAVKGFEQTTLDEIAVASEFGKGTIYNYFQNKEDLYEAILEKSLKDHNNLMEEISQSTESFRDFVTVLTKQVLRYSRENMDSFMLIAKQRTKAMFANNEMNQAMKNKHDEAVTIFRERIECAINKGEIENVNPYSVIILYRSMIYPYTFFCFNNHGKENLDVEKEADFLLSVFFNGILKK